MTLKYRIKIEVEGYICRRRNYNFILSAGMEM